ncbi:transcriptional regulator [Duganella sp. BJB488]|uniref:helix-turn-helix domain-containing transcriptional regulator n=1 Tax=unclassified Duganella TaxID=2636909 RepID=UPI000E344D84|nr:MULTISPECIES: transcriptional regulator [unclassified Duganella]RFP14049.1 transcriptional regulator [Duganella sp. BJB489]RFP17367.1 transcriptional regulator [Duganella sp. BJB488]RFP31843.1 transcriptional regulator [Duganella sp. BJB480]
MAEKFSPYDPAQALSSREAIEIFMTDAFETGDAVHIAAALDVVAKAQGLTQLGGEPSLKTTLALMKAFGLRLTIAASPAGTS